MREASVFHGGRGGGGAIKAISRDDKTEESYVRTALCVTIDGENVVGACQ